MKIIVTGAGGQLGEELVELLRPLNELLGFTHADLDITAGGKVKEIVKKIDPDAIVNAAAYTDVDGAESEPGCAFAVNASGVKWLTEVAEDVDAQLVHISTDYVFSGDKPEPYTIEDCPHPINTYGVSKLGGEYFALHYSGGTVIRTSGVYGGEPGKHDNIVNTVLDFTREQAELTFVVDQISAPTWSRPVAGAVQTVLEEKITGLLHFTAAGQCSPFEFTKFLIQELEIDIPIKPIKSRDLNLSASRPKNSVLENSWQAESWKKMLQDYLYSISHRISFNQSLN